MSSQKELLNSILSTINNGDVSITEGIPLKISYIFLSTTDGLTITGKGKVILAEGTQGANHNSYKIDKTFNIDGQSLKNMVLPRNCYIEFEFSNKVVIGTESSSMGGLFAVIIQY